VHLLTCHPSTAVHWLPLEFQYVVHVQKTISAVYWHLISKPRSKLWGRSQNVPRPEAETKAMVVRLRSRPKRLAIRPVWPRGLNISNSQQNNRTGFLQHWNRNTVYMHLMWLRHVHCISSASYKAVNWNYWNDKYFEFLINWMSVDEIISCK